MRDLEEREWWVFQLPAATSYVPARSEAEARDSLRRTAYEKAPIETWPLVATRVCSRQALTRSLLASRSSKGTGTSGDGSLTGCSTESTPGSAT